MDTFVDSFNNWGIDDVCWFGLAWSYFFLNKYAIYTAGNLKNNLYIFLMLWQVLACISAPFSIMAIVLSLILICQHKKNYIHPYSQRWVIILLFMVNLKRIYASFIFEYIFWLCLFTMGSLFFLLNWLLLKVPIYATSAWCGIVFVRFHIYTEFVRACYEAVCLYSFMMLLTRCVFCFLC